MPQVTDLSHIVVSSTTPHYEWDSNSQL
jgi:hypothetical protein